MSTEQSLEDRARAYVLKWCNAIIRGDKATAALTDILRAVDAAATERATEAARGEVERLRADIASQADGLSNYMDKVTQQAVDIQRLRERLAVELKRIEAAERLIVRCIPCVCPFPRTGCPSCNRACDACDYGAFAAAAATPAAPVTPAEKCGMCGGTCDPRPSWVCRSCGEAHWKTAPVTPVELTHEESTDGGKTWRSVATPASGDIPLRYGVLVRKSAPATVTPVEPNGVLTVSCPHGPEACDGCLSAAVEGRPLPAVTPKGEPGQCEMCGIIQGRGRGNPHICAATGKPHGFRFHKEGAADVSRVGLGVQESLPAQVGAVTAAPPPPPSETPPSEPQGEAPPAPAWPPKKGDRIKYLPDGEVLTFTGLRNNGGGYDLLDGAGRCTGGLIESAANDGNWMRLPSEAAPTARVKCDHGDACPGHAPGDRPCNWEPSPEAAPPAAFVVGIGVPIDLRDGATRDVEARDAHIRAECAADRDAAVSRARAEQLAMALRRVDQSKPLRPLEHDTEYGKGWRHCYEQIRAQVASLSSTTETPTTKAES